MAWKIVRRNFKALQFEKGSPDRNRLNKRSLTSEFARRLVWLVVDEKNKPLKTFKTIKDCNEFIKNPEKFKPKTRFKKYTRDKFIKSCEFFAKKKNNLKTSLKY